MDNCVATSNVCVCASMTAKCHCIDTNICYREWQSCVVGYYRLPQRYTLPAYLYVSPLLQDPLPTSHPLYDTPTESAVLPGKEYRDNLQV